MTSKFGDTRRKSDAAYTLFAVSIKLLALVAVPFQAKVLYVGFIFTPAFICVGNPGIKATFASITGAVKSSLATIATKLPPTVQRATVLENPLLSVSVIASH